MVSQQKIESREILDKGEVGESLSKMKLHQLIGILISILATGAMVVSCVSPVPSGTPPPSGQGLMEKLTLEELTARADSIMVGEVTDIACYEENKGNIYTLITLSVGQTVKGESEEEVVIKVPGGEVGENRLIVEDSPSFQLGERAVVFLKEGGDNKFSVVGGFQGKFGIDEGDMVSGNIPLTQFIDQIRNIVAKQ